MAVARPHRWSLTVKDDGVSFRGDVFSVFDDHDLRFLSV